MKNLQMESLLQVIQFTCSTGSKESKWKTIFAQNETALEPVLALKVSCACLEQNSSITIFMEKNSEEREGESGG